MPGYIELLLGVRLFLNTPEKVVETLHYLCGDKREIGFPPNYEFPDHPFFKVKNGINLFKGVEINSGEVISFYPREKGYILGIKAQVNDYELLLAYFLDWISPYSDVGAWDDEDENLQTLGYRLLGEFNERMLIYLIKNKKEILLTEVASIVSEEQRRKGSIPGEVEMMPLLKKLVGTQDYILNYRKENS